MAEPSLICETIDCCSPSLFSFDSHGAPQQFIVTEGDRIVIMTEDGESGLVTEG